MSQFHCQCCGQSFDGLPMDLAYGRPPEYFGVPEGEREQRVRCNDDLCIVDGEVYAIRGVLELPIPQTGGRFGWGVWALVDRADFDRYVTAWKTGAEADLPAFSGRLTGGMKPYPDSDLLPLTITAHPDGIRPTFVVESADHPLGRDQRAGITLEKAHSFVTQVLPAPPRRLSWLAQLRRSKRSLAAGHCAWTRQR